MESEKEIRFFSSASASFIFVAVGRFVLTATTELM